MNKLTHGPSSYKIFTAVLVNRISQALDTQLHETQYGFRKKRSTAHAIYLLRRIVDLGERSGNKIHMVLLDWEKAFDKLTHDALFKAMEKMGVDQKIMRLVKMIYKNPTFRVEVEGETSEWKRQNAGIRQGCPMSPYLFLIAMTTLFSDVKKDNDEVRGLTASNRISGATFDELLYADDTILISESKEAVQKYLHQIEKESKKYGMNLNKTKCEVLTINGDDPIFFSDGVRVPPHDRVKYLGCMINDKGDPKQEVNKRISECIVIWKKLDPLWKHATNPTRCKLLVYNAIVRSKLMYGLESAQLNDSIKKKLDAFQLKGLRKILGMTTTYINRANTNDEVFKRAEELINPGITPGPGYKKILRLSEYYEVVRRKTTLNLIAQRNQTDPRVGITMQNENLKMKEYNIKRVGRPKMHGGHTLF